MNFKKLFFTLFITLFSASILLAANPQKEVVGLYSFDYLRGVNQVYPITLAGHLSQKLTCFNDIDVLKQSTFPLLGQALEDSKRPESALAETVQQGRRVGATKILSGFITAVTEEYDHVTKSLRISIIMEIGIIDIETGKLENSKQFIFNGIDNIGLIIKVLQVKSGTSPDLMTIEMVRTAMGEKGIVKAIERTLSSFDAELGSFLFDHFGEYDQKCLIGRNSVASPVSQKDDVFEIVNSVDEKSILIEANGNTKWIKRLTAFDILTEIEETDLRGNIIHREVKVGSAKFASYSSEYAIIKLDKKSDITVDEIVAFVKNADNIYVKRKSKKVSDD